jgi:HD-like signal output (HDOD) protein
MEKNLSIRDYIEHNLESEDLDLPFPESIAVELNSMMGDDNVTVHALAQKIEKDPSLTAKILNLSNSAFYSGLEKTRTVDRAISRIGVKSMKNLLMSMIMKEVFVVRDGFLKDYFTTNWRHSLGCAICAKAIAEQAKLKSIAEDAYILGLIHDIGTMFILNMLVNLKKESKGDLDLNEDLVKEILVAFHPAIGAKVLEKFNFDTHYCRIVSTHHDPDMYDNQEDSLFNILQIANNLMRKVGISITFDKDVSIISLPSTARLGLDPLFIATLEIDIEEKLVTMDDFL